MTTSIQDLEEELARLPHSHPERRAAVVRVLRALQADRGYLDDAAVARAARLTGLSATQIEELATFYSLLYRRPVGRHVLLICDGACCAMQGSEALLRRFDLGTVSPDGVLTVLPSICLGLCERAPAALLDGQAVGPLDEDGLEGLLKAVRMEKT